MDKKLYTVELVYINSHTNFAFLANNQQDAMDQAKEKISNGFRHFGTVSVTRLRKAKIKHSPNRGKSETFEALAAITGGFLCYVKNDVFYSYRCGTSTAWMKEGEINCLIYHDDHTVKFI